MELPFGGTSASDTFDTGTRAAAWGGTTTIIDFAVQRTGEVVQDGLAAWHAKAEGNCHIDYGFHMILGGVDDDALKAMDQLVADEGITELQAVHGLPGRLLLRRRPDPAGDADRAGERRDDHDARGERHRDRRPRAAGAGARRDRPDLPRHHPSAGAGGRGHQPGDRAGGGGPGLPALHRAPVRQRGAGGRRAGARRRPQRVRRDLPAVPLSDARGPARRARLRGRQVGVLDAAAQQARVARQAICGRACAPTTSRSCRPTTARSA